MKGIIQLAFLLLSMNFMLVYSQSSDTLSRPGQSDCWPNNYESNWSIDMAYSIWCKFSNGSEEHCINLAPGGVFRYIRKSDTQISFAAGNWKERKGTMVILMIDDSLSQDLKQAYTVSLGPYIGIVPFLESYHNIDPAISGYRIRYASQCLSLVGKMVSGVHVIPFIALGCPGGRRLAQKDAEQGILRLKRSGRSMGSVPHNYKVYTADDVLRRKFGIDIQKEGCDTMGMYECYNSVMDSLIRLKYGENVFIRAKYIADSLTALREPR